MKVPGELNQVESFWRVEACGTHFVDGFANRREFFAKFREHRNRVLQYIPRLVPFEEAAGKSVLEIGCGNGSDGVMFASRGARYTGVDLTQTAVDATSEHFRVLGLEGTFHTADAENLSFPDASFDFVYSLGVLHHTPNPRRAIDEVHRVLRPNGKAIVMLYHKNSINYYLRILGYMRFRVLVRILSRLGRWDSDRRKMASKSILELRGNQTAQILERPLQELPGTWLELSRHHNFRPPLHRWPRVSDSLCLHQVKRARGLLEIPRRRPESRALAAPPVSRELVPAVMGKPCGIQMGVGSHDLRCEADRSLTRTLGRREKELDGIAGIS